MNEVRTFEAYDAWFLGLDKEEQATVVSVVRKLEVQWLRLGDPHSTAIHGVSFGLRELRPKAGRSPLRVFYAFDPKRRAVLIVGGDKAGDNGFYDRMKNVCEVLWEVYLNELNAGLHD